MNKMNVSFSLVALL